jgi:ABC-type microcin C transport system duplicated ATPase subunit YejF
LTVCQVRTAANAMIFSQAMTPGNRVIYLEKQAAIINYQQQRNADARKAHRKATLRTLHQLGIKLTALKRCQRE